MLKQYSDVISECRKPAASVKNFKSKVGLGFNLIDGTAVDQPSNLGSSITAVFLRHDLQSSRKEIEKFDVFLMCINLLHSIFRYIFLDNCLNLT